MFFVWAKYNKRSEVYKAICSARTEDRAPKAARRFDVPGSDLTDGKVLLLGQRGFYLEMFTSARSRVIKFRSVCATVAEIAFFRSLKCSAITRARS